MNLTANEKRTVKAVFSELLKKPYYELYPVRGSITVDEMRTLYLKLRYEKYCEDHGIRFEDMDEMDIFYAEKDIENSQCSENK